MSRDLGDLTPEEWERAGELFERTGAKIAEDSVFVRSHQWPNADGTCDWMVFVPGTSHRARGTADSVELAQRAINDQIKTWYPDVRPSNIGVAQRIVP